MNIEAEIRSFVSEEKFKELLAFFQENAEFIKEDDQQTFYFDSDADVRIQRNQSGAKITMKQGKVHDEAREEVEVAVHKDDFSKLEQIFEVLGHEVEIKWFRKRYQFQWDEIIVCLDDTKGYGRIIELEQMCSADDQERVAVKLTEKLTELGVEITPREEFERVFEEYKQEWRSRV